MKKNHLLIICDKNKINRGKNINKVNGIKVAILLKILLITTINNNINNNKMIAVLEEM